MPKSTIKNVEKWDEKDSEFKGLEFLTKNKEEFEFVNEDYDDNLIKREEQAPYSAVPAKFSMVELATDHPIPT